jgi:hypothetical protein
MATKRKKVRSPTGKPSKVNPDLDPAMKGKGGSRESRYTGTVVDTPTGGKRGMTRAEMMDAGMMLRAKKRKSKVK